jgi:hypothetical protein
MVFIRLLWSCSSYFFKTPKVTGVIQEISLAEVPRKVEGAAPLKETRIKLQITEMNKTAKNYISETGIVELKVHENLLHQFREGDKVTCTFDFYLIKTIVKVED